MKTGSLSKLSKQCEKCKYKDDCDEKRMMACAYINAPPLMAEMSAPLTQDKAAPVLRKHDYRDIKIDANTTITIDIEELKERMVKEHYKDIGCPAMNFWGGA